MLAKANIIVKAFKAPEAGFFAPGASFLPGHSRETGEASWM
jgi:hypothetical protein